MKLVIRLERALDVQKEGKARGMELIFAKFDRKRHLWASAAQATAMLDALGSLAQASSGPNFSRPEILDCPLDGSPSIHVVQGRHPCVDITHNGGQFIPNDLTLGQTPSQEDAMETGSGTDPPSSTERVLLLSGPNMGGKSTLLRQTCLIAILAQIGCFVPAAECKLTPIDRIFTRLGASDRILLGQSTFFVELAETASALRGATRRSLVIMDELGRGTSTFDGTAIASACVRHLVQQNRCLTLFATHYHSLLREWQNEESVRLGHMQCYVEGGVRDHNENNNSDKDNNATEKVGKDTNEDHNITFLYTLAEGSCPASFGINVAKLAGLPDEVLSKAKTKSTNFEQTMKRGAKHSSEATGDRHMMERICQAVEDNDHNAIQMLWESASATQG